MATTNRNLHSFPMLKYHKYSRIFLAPDTGDLSGAKPPVTPKAEPTPAPVGSQAPPAHKPTAVAKAQQEGLERNTIQVSGEDQDRREIHAREAARTLRDQAETEARRESDRTGRHVDPKPTPSAEDLLNEPYTSEGAALRIPTTAEARPGETANGPATAAFAHTRVVPEHMVSNVAVVPTVNAPGLGADTGIKHTPDNVDARGGSGHDDGPDPADALKTAQNPNGFAGIPGVHSETRSDTAEANADRIAEARAKAADTTAENGAEAREQTAAEESLAGK